MNPRRLKPFMQAYKEGQQEEFKKLDLSAWLHGRYIVDSVSCVLADNHQYPQKPMFSDQEQEEVSETKRAAQDFAIYAEMLNHKLFPKGDEVHADGD